MMLSKNVDDKTIINELDVRVILKRSQKSSFNFLSRNVLMMKYSKSRVSAFFSQFIIATRLLVKFCSPFNYLIHPIRPFLYHNFHDMRIAQSITGNQCVFDMLFKTITFRIVDNSYSALCIFRIGLV